MAQLVMTIIAGLVVAGYGLVALFWPEKIQKWWISQSLRRRVALKIYGLLVESPRYLLYLRVTGAIALIVALILFYSATRLAGAMIR